VSASLLVLALVERLHKAGYDSLATPFRVASVEFEFTAALRGRRGRALDLVLIVDTSTGEHGDRDPREVQRRIEALSRALDITQSRYVITLILAGATLVGDIDLLTQTCRVLIVETAALDDKGQAVDEAAAQSFDDQIRLLLPLDLSDEANQTETGVDAIAALTAALPSDLDAVLPNAVIAASTRGEAAVTSALSKVLAESLQLQGEP
jgi:hypothetical protein